jgi:hypothetical protein
MKCLCVGTVLLLNTLLISCAKHPVSCRTCFLLRHSEFAAVLAQNV